MTSPLNNELLLALMPEGTGPFDAEVAVQVLSRISKGEPLASICRDEGFPSVWTVQRWRKRVPEFDKAFDEARDLGFDALAEECVEIAEDGTNDYVEKRAKDGSTYVALDAEHVQRSKLRIETRLKLLAKWDRKRYGDHQAVEMTGKDGAPLMSDTQAAAKLASLMATAQARRERAKSDDENSDLA